MLVSFFGVSTFDGPSIAEIPKANLAHCCITRCRNIRLGICCQDEGLMFLNRLKIKPEVVVLEDSDGSEMPESDSETMT